MTNNGQDQRLQQVAQIWQEAYQQVGTPDKTPQALALGWNFRINVAKALEAAASTIKVIMDGAKIYAGQAALVDWIGLPAEVISAITSTFSALIETMPPIEYVACVMLSGHPDGLDQGALQAEIEQFLKDPKAKKLPWYLGISKGKVGDAQKAAKAKDWMDHLVDDLRKHDWLIENGSLLKFKSRNFTLGMKFE